MEKLDFFKKYCKIKGLEKKFGFGKIEGDKKTIVLINGEITEHLEYQGEHLKDGVLYKVSPATCGNGKSEGGDGSCEIGNRKLSCNAYSRNKCAVYFHYEINIENFKYELSFEEFVMLQAE